MSLGGAAGHAADMALEANVPVQQVNVGALQERIWSHGGATIHVSDVPPDHPDFTAVQWWAGLGGLHGLEPAPAKPDTRGKHIVSQYFEAFPGHAANLDKPLDEELSKRWSALAKKHNLPVPLNQPRAATGFVKCFINQLLNHERQYQTNPCPPDGNVARDAGCTER